MSAHGEIRCPPHVHDHARCVRCGGPACSACDRCHGCDQVVCEGCEAGGGEPFAFPGDAHAHPHCRVFLDEEEW